MDRAVSIALGESLAAHHARVTGERIFPGETKLKLPSELRFYGNTPSARIARLPHDQASISGRNRKHFQIIHSKGIADPSVEVKPALRAETQTKER